MFIRVIYKDKSAGLIEAFRLDHLLASGKVAAFQRSNGWVSTFRDPVRGNGAREYMGPERRRRSVFNAIGKKLLRFTSG
jgi:hypothetical protein